jgi:hypothetical protein
MALNLLKNEKTAKGGIHAKRLQAGWNNDYLLSVLNGQCEWALRFCLENGFDKTFDLKLLDERNSNTPR